MEWRGGAKLNTKFLWACFNCMGSTLAHIGNLLRSWLWIEHFLVCWKTCWAWFGAIWTYWANSCCNVVPPFICSGHCCSHGLEVARDHQCRPERALRCQWSVGKMWRFPKLRTSGPLNDQIISTLCPTLTCCDGIYQSPDGMFSESCPRFGRCGGLFEAQAWLALEPLPRAHFGHSNVNPSETVRRGRAKVLTLTYQGTLQTTSGQ